MTGSKFSTGIEAELTLCAKTSEGETINQDDLIDEVEFFIKPRQMLQMWL